MIRHHSSACRCGIADFIVFFSSSSRPLRVDSLGTRLTICHNRSFSSCCEPHYESEANCKVLIMKTSFHSYANKTNFHMKSFALSLTFMMRFTTTRKWPIEAGERRGRVRLARESTLSAPREFLVSEVLVPLCEFHEGKRLFCSSGQANSPEFSAYFPPVLTFLPFSRKLVEIPALYDMFCSNKRSTSTTKITFFSGVVLGKERVC